MAVDSSDESARWQFGSLIQKGRPIGAAPPPGDQRPLGAARRQGLANLVAVIVVKPAFPISFSSNRRCVVFCDAASVNLIAQGVTNRSVATQL